jgi:hypothetical protein
MSKTQDNTSSTGSYGGSAIRLTSRRTSMQSEQRQSTRRPSGPAHQQGHTFGIYPADEPYESDSFALEGADYPGEPVRRRTGAVKYPLSQRTLLLPEYKKTRRMRRRFDRTSLVTWLCLAIIVMVGGWWLLSTVANWWQGVQENVEYGFPRTFQADQYVGLGDSPQHPDHFIALNLHGVIEVIQLNPLDRAKDAVYVLASVGNDSTPASLSFRDTTGDGRTDVIVTIGDSTPYTIVLLNNGKTLTPTQPAH